MKRYMVAHPVDYDLPDVAAGVPKPFRSHARASWTWAVSIGLHVVAVVAVGEWALRSMAHDSPPALEKTAEHLYPIDLPRMTESSLVNQVTSESVLDPVGEVPNISGGPTVPRVDTGRDGRGGERTVDRAATHLSDVDERMQLSRGTLNRIDRDQVQRVHVTERRESREDRRSSREPMDLAFLSSGDLERLERRTPSDRDPSRGVLASQPASTQGGALGLATHAGEDTQGLVGTGHDGVAASAPGLGVRDGVPGLEHRMAASVTHARPDVVLASVSVEAPSKGRPTDNVDSEQELAAKVQALVHASTAGGVVAPDGRGGTNGGGAAGAGGFVGAGSHPTPLGDGTGDWFDLSSTDPRVVAYFRRFHAKVEPLWANAFPKSAMLELKQGTVILEVTIAADGTAQVAWPPARPSGIPEFDRNCAEAIRKASPFDPLPPEMGLTTLHVRAPFVATNPIVH